MRVHVCIYVLICVGARYQLIRTVMRNHETRPCDPPVATNLKPFDVLMDPACLWPLPGCACSIKSSLSSAPSALSHQPFRGDNCWMCCGGRRLPVWPRLYCLFRLRPTTPITILSTALGYLTVPDNELRIQGIFGNTRDRFSTLLLRCHDFFVTIGPSDS
jgi:hypothetical protein